jgi:hypothetical protein
MTRDLRTRDFNAGDSSNSDNIGQKSPLKFAFKVAQIQMRSIRMYLTLTQFEEKSLEMIEASSRSYHLSRM